MNVTDSQRASLAALWMVGGLAANVGLTVLSYAVNWLLPGSYEGAFPFIQELLWMVATGVLAVGLLQLSAAVDEPLLLRAAAVLFIVSSLVDVAETLLRPKLGLGGSVGMAIYDVSILSSLGARGLLMFCLARLSMKTHAWVVPLLATVALLTLMRTAFNVASIHRLVPVELYRNRLYGTVMPFIGLFHGGAMLVAGLALKGAVSGAPNTPALVAAAGLQPAPAQPISPAADFLVGAILLVVGVGVTGISLAAASNGGRYVVATGAIAVGIGRIIRGFIRLGRAG